MLLLRFQALSPIFRVQMETMVKTITITNTCHIPDIQTYQLEIQYNY